jgi:uncharacterized protein YutE (UPF0331/DUF86 family)
LPASYREIFSTLEQAGVLPSALAADLIAACGMRNVPTHLYEQIDLGRVVAAVDPAMVLNGAFAQWTLDQLGGAPATAEAPTHESPAGPE